MGGKNQRTVNSAGAGPPQGKGGKDCVKAALERSGMESAEKKEESCGGQGGGKRGDADDAPILLTAKEAAAFCMLSESYFYKLHRKGHVPKSLRIGTMHRWRKRDLVDWVAAGCPQDWSEQ